MHAQVPFFLNKEFQLNFAHTACCLQINVIEDFAPIQAVVYPESINLNK